MLTHFRIPVDVFIYICVYVCVRIYEHTYVCMHVCVLSIHTRTLFDYVLSVCLSVCSSVQLSAKEKNKLVVINRYCDVLCVNVKKNHLESLCSI